MRIFSSLIAASMLLASLSVAALPAAVTVSAPTTTQPPTIAPCIVPQDSNIEQRLLEQENKHLREQNAVIESYHESVLETSYFALGSVLTMTVILLGYSWWFNTRAYESDKRALREELQTKISAAESRVALREQEQRSAAEAAINARIDAATAAQSANYNSLLSDVAKMRASSDQAVALINERHSLFAREFRIVEDMVWDLRGVPSNSVLSLAQAVRLCAADEDDKMFDIIAGRLEKRVNELIGNADKMSDGTRAQVEKNLAKSSKRWPERIQALLDLVAQIERAESSES